VFEWADLAAILILVVLEGILSADNALVLAVLVLQLPEDQQRKALRYGILGAFVLRAIATLLAVKLSQVTWVALLGGAYLLYLPYKHFTQHPDETDDPSATRTVAAAGFLGLSAFWVTVIKVELTDLVFAVDSILVAVAISKKPEVIITGGILGIIMMRMLTLQVLALVRRYPKLIDGAYIIVAWVGVKLLWEYLHKAVVIDGHHPIPELPRAVALTIVVILFVASFLYARKHPAPVTTGPDLTERLFSGEADGGDRGAPPVAGGAAAEPEGETAEAARVDAEPQPAGVKREG
jgi:YkoY family integral membrane protein